MVQRGTVTQLMAGGLLAIPVVMPVGITFGIIPAIPGLVIVVTMIVLPFGSMNTHKAPKMGEPCLPERKDNFPGRNDNHDPMSVFSFFSALASHHICWLNQQI
jgi:hypothetical protein